MQGDFSPAVLYSFFCEIELLEQPREQKAVLWVWWCGLEDVI